MKRPTRIPALSPLLVILLHGAVAWTSPAHADPVVGFLEDFPGTSVQGWGSLAIVENPGTGGVGGTGDGFLRIARTEPDRLGAVSFGTEYLGDWIAAGVRTLRLWLDDVDGDEALEVHVAIGNAGNFWLSNPGLIPPSQQWSVFHVDLTSESAFTQIIGPGSFEDALRTADRIHIRHDQPPLTMSPDFIAGDVGVDRIELLSGTLGAPPRGTSLPVELAPPYPNPSSGPVAVTLTASEPGEVRLEIVDAAGRRVRSAALNVATPGARLWVWDGRDDAGRPAAPGAYRVRAIGPSGGGSRPLIRVR